MKFIDDQNVNQVIRRDNTCDSEVGSSESNVDFHEVMKSFSDDFDTDDEVPLSKMGKSLSGPSTSSPVTDREANSATSKNPITVKTKGQYRWRHIGQDQKNLLQNTTFVADQNKKHVFECESALTYFKRFFDDEMINLICEG